MDVIGPFPRPEARCEYDRPVLIQSLLKAVLKTVVADEFGEAFLGKACTR